MNASARTASDSSPPPPETAVATAEKLAPLRSDLESLFAVLATTDWGGL